MTIREEQIINAFIMTGSYTHAGKSVGVSHQRVEQLVKKYRESLPKVKAVWETMRHGRFKECTVCKRGFDVVKQGGKGLCTSCYIYCYIYKRRENSTHNRYRQLFSPENCMVCGIKTKRGRKLGMCPRCYDKKVRSHTESFKKAQGKYNNKPEIKEKRGLSNKKYYLEHKEKLREYYKKYRQEHREQIKEYQRTSYQKRKKK